MTEFEEIYRTYFSDVYNYIRRLSGDENVAEEITGETFFRALREADKFRGDCEIRVWLCQIAKNCYFSDRKKARKTENLGDNELKELPSAELTEEKIIDRSEAMRIRRALHHIPEPYKEVFMWRVFAELGFRQIGSMFGKSENWACVTYHRARKMIRNRLEEDDNCE